MKFQQWDDWVIALVCGECELQLAVFVCFHFSLQSQGQCEMFPSAMLATRSRWATQLPRGGLCPRYQHEQMFKQWPDFCWSTILPKPWLSSALTWGLSHSFSKELQHLKVIALLPRVAEVAREREQDLGVIHTHFIKVQWQPSHQRKQLEGDPWTSRWKCCGLLKFCAPCFADRSGTSAWGEVTKS